MPGATNLTAELDRIRIELGRLRSDNARLAIENGQLKARSVAAVVTDSATQQARQINDLAHENARLAATVEAQIHEIDTLRRANRTFAAAESVESMP